MNGLESLYKTERDAALWGDNWCGPETLHHTERTLIATFDGEEDGKAVEVFVTACPARFYTIACGDRRIDTGSGMDGFTHRCAEALASGAIELC